MDAFTDTKKQMLSKPRRQEKKWLYKTRNLRHCMKQPIFDDRMSHRGSISSFSASAPVSEQTTSGPLKWRTSSLQKLRTAKQFSPAQSEVRRTTRRISNTWTTLPQESLSRNAQTNGFVQYKLSTVNAHWYNRPRGVHAEIGCFEG